MLSFSRKTDYALIALAHLAMRQGQTVAAREIAQTYRLPQALVMRILKTLHHAQIVASVRGMKGGYQLAADLHQVSLFELIEVLNAMDTSEAIGEGREWFREASLLAVHGKLMRVLKEVKLSDLILPGHRIDVPVELVGRRKLKNEPTATALVG